MIRIIVTSRSHRTTAAVLCVDDRLAAVLRADAILGEIPEKMSAFHGCSIQAFITACFCGRHPPPLPTESSREKSIQQTENILSFRPFCILNVQFFRSFQRKKTTGLLTSPFFGPLTFCLPLLPPHNYVKNQSPPLCFQATAAPALVVHTFFCLTQSSFSSEMPPCRFYLLKSCAVRRCRSIISS